MTLQMIQREPVDMLMPIWTSALFGAVMLGLAVLAFRKRDF